jgi:hypothetical protein
MKTRIMLMVLFLGMSVPIFAQEIVMAQRTMISGNDPKVINTLYSFEFLAYSQTEALKNITKEDAGDHFLGDAIARKVYLLNSVYCYREPVAPGTTATKIIFRKPEIYNSVKKIERFLKKKVKSGEISDESARNQYNKVLDVAINIMDVNTDTFESRLKSTNGPAELLGVFLNEVKLNYIN